MGQSDGLRGVLADARLRSLIRELGHALAHDVGGPAKKVAAFAALLREDLGAGLGADAAESLDCLEVSAEEFSSRLRRFLDWCRLPEAPEEPQRVCVGKLLEQVAAERPESRWRASGESLELLGEQRLLVRLLLELLQNAALYGATEEPQVCVFQDPEGVRLEVRDAGEGLSVERRERACEPFRRFVGASKIPGAGLGLAIAQRIAELHGGRLVLQDAQPGLCVRVEFYS